MEQQQQYQHQHHQFSASPQQPSPAHFSVANSTDGHPTPVATPQFSPSHPSYAEMITAAILWDSSQGKAGGSSKRAIAKYIDRVYTNLPPTHSTLLTHHLRKLKASGHLVMIKNSYQLPVVAAAHANANTNANVTDAVPLRSVNPASGLGLDPGNSSSGKRRPGRPPKPKTEAQQQQHQQQHQHQHQHQQNSEVVNGSVTGKRPRGRPPRQQQVQQQHQQQPVVAEVPFVQQTIPVSPQMKVQSNGQQESVKRRPGRPPTKGKKAQPAVQAMVVVPANGVVQKKRPGRPPKADSAANAAAVAAAAKPAGTTPKPRGRPKRNALGPASKTIEKKPRGRPPRQAGAAPGFAVAGRRRPGRPPKASAPPAKLKLSRQLYTGKPRGRPKKNASVEGKQSSEQVAANEELTRKVENMQATIRDAVGVIKPCLSNGNSADALKALQQLEDLLTMNSTGTPTPTPVEPPMTAMSVDETVQVELTTTSMPATQTTTAPPGTIIVPTVMPFSIAAPPMTENAPLYAPTIGTEQPASWIPSSEAQF